MKKTSEIANYKEDAFFCVCDEKYTIYLSLTFLVKKFFSFRFDWTSLESQRCTTFLLIWENKISNAEKKRIKD